MDIYAYFSWLYSFAPGYLHMYEAWLDVDVSEEKILGDVAEIKGVEECIAYRGKLIVYANVNLCIIFKIEGNKIVYGYKQKR